MLRLLILGCIRALGGNTNIFEKALTYIEYATNLQGTTTKRIKLKKKLILSNYRKQEKKTSVCVCFFAVSIKWHTWRQNLHPYVTVLVIGIDHLFCSIAGHMLILISLSQKDFKIMSTLLKWNVANLQQSHHFITTRLLEQNIST